jgi:elongation factor Ts
MHVAALEPAYIGRENVPAELIDEQKRLFTVDAEREGRPADRIPMIVEGKLNKWFEQICLLEQPYRDTDQKVGDLITEKVALLGENIQVARFARMAVGESAPADADGDEAAESA